MYRRLISGLALICIAGTAGYNLDPFNQQASNSRSLENGRVRYARACVRLAQVDLELGRSLQREGVIGHSHVERLRSNVMVAKEQLRIAGEKSDLSTMPVMAAYAEVAVKAAIKEFEEVKAANASLPGTLAALELDKFRLKAEVAELRAELWRDPANLPSLVDEMQWQIDRLTEQVISLEQRIQMIE